jgi:hypothetical protein
MHFQLLAQPWWVNLLILVPVLAAIQFFRRGPELSGRQLFAAALFAIGFGFVEAVVVVYLRSALMLLGVGAAAINDTAQMNAILSHPSPEMLRMFKIEALREAATIVMLVSVSALGASRLRERWAMFLWCFAIWDVVYYAGLWATLHWPASLLDSDVLFLIPVPWIAQVWFPVLVSGLTILIVLVTSLRRAN